MNIGFFKLLQFTCRALKAKTVLQAAKIGCFLAIQSSVALAQETPLSQPYAHRLFLNPAFTGLLSDYSVTAGHSSQWTGTNSGYSTQVLSGEYRFSENRNAVGLTFASDRSPAGGFTKLQAGALYAYHTKLRQHLDLSVGLQAAYGSLSPSSRLVFEDQLAPDGSITSPTAERNSFERASYGTVAAGFLLFTRQFWVGASAQHLNSPALGESSDNTIPPVFQAHTGYRFYVKQYFVRNFFKEVSFIPTFSYTQQRAFKRADATFYGIVTPVTIGLGYSMLPGEKNLPAASTISGLAGVSHKGFKIGYSYRHPLSASPVALGPTHEISLSFEKVDYLKIFKRSGTDKNYNRIACPAF
ncbi:PorP/SprF family type IX secretion system membrane protein [Rufibacter ruber]|uniref:PorP/SprF family type IX secretion system membrane protein n=1 Tax=Rufibacter ruber TaxID=1783499 RepID=UPI000943E2CF|nr:PorP/SprF family type IX secretion system membrane protein [Rufibacter ruber]